MQLWTVLAWIAVIYSAGRLLAVLFVAVAGRDQSASPEGAAPSARVLLMVFAAWPVVLVLTASVGLHATLQRFRARL